MAGGTGEPTARAASAPSAETAAGTGTPDSGQGPSSPAGTPARTATTAGRDPANETATGAPTDLPATATTPDTTGTTGTSGAAATDTSDTTSTGDTTNTSDTAGTGDTTDTSGTTGAGGRRGARWAAWVTRAASTPSPGVTVAGLTAVLTVPLVVALGALRTPRWYPLFDMAQYEMYVRDVATTHPPLLGLTGRIFGYGAVGSHPGPIGFYLLWPVYRLLGSDGWSLQASSATLVVAATALAVWLGHRRGGRPLALAVAAMMALLLRAYGVTVLMEAWNPLLPLIWWVAFLLAVWSVLCGDRRAVPIAVVTGTVCMQTHISYIPLVGGLGALAAGALALRAWRAWRARPEGDRAQWRRLLAWGGGSAALLAILWLPPVVEQVTHTPGNFSVIRHNFTDPVDDRIDLDAALAIWVEHHDVTALTRAEVRPAFPYIGIPINETGLVVLAVWAAAAVVAWRSRSLAGNPALRRLHLVAGLATGLGLLGTTRIIGPPWPYLTYWGWGTTAVMMLATAWTFLSVGAAAVRSPEGDAEVVPALRWPGATSLALGLAVLLLVGLFTVDATDAEVDEAAVSAALGRVARATVDRLDEDPAGCGGDGCRVLVTWSGDINPVAPGMGMMMALEREGYDARSLGGMEPWVRSHRITRRSDVDVQVHVASSPEAIRDWRRRSAAELVAEARPSDPRRDPVAAFLVVRDVDGTRRRNADG